MVSVNLYFDSYGLTDETTKIRYTLSLLEGAAALWQQDYIANHPLTGANIPSWADFTTSLEQSFAPVQQTHEAEQKLRRLRQRGRYIEEYIAEFAVLASQAGLTADNTALRAYFAEGLDDPIRFEALRSSPRTINDWKDAARTAYRIISEQNKYRSRSNSYPKGQRKGKGNRSNPRYVDIRTQPVQSKFKRNEWDMDVDYLSRTINEIDIMDSEEEEEFQQEESEDEEDEIDNIRTSTRQDTGKEALKFLINNILTDEQRVALKQGLCFFCKQKGHFYRDCEKRKVFLKARGKGSMGKKQPRQGNYNN